LPSAERRVPAVEWDEFVHEVRRRAGIDLKPYKASQVQRRVQGLMLRSGVGHLGDYLRLLDREPDRRSELQTCVTVAVSEFFRSPAQFRHLAETILPRLLGQRANLRIWSAGCSYGVEPYSIAILLHELASKGRHYLLATDVDELALARARAADSFTERDLRHVRPQRRAHFGPSRHEGRQALSKPLSSRVTFRKHDLLCDPAESDFDLIVCRNVMMYFTDDAKQRLYRTLYGALRPGGSLFVGDAEVLNRLSEAGFTREAVGFYRKQSGEV
jgi:chemotaxis protein methyltransferase CheR